MRSAWLILLLFTVVAWSQKTIQQLTADERNCQDAKCKARAALQISEWYNEKDIIERAQSWLDYAKAQHRKQPDAVMSACICSLQSELFYYMGLYQFGIHEAEKQIDEASTLGDSALVADGWFFKGINLFETGKIHDAEKSLWKSLHHFPHKPARYPRTIINSAYLYNNLAQIKVKKAQPDSALFYNRLAYKLAVQNQTLRAKANAEQLFGEIFVAAKNPDSARHYFRLSIETAQTAQNFDVALNSIGYLMRVSPQSAEVSELYRQGLEIINRHEVNNLYKTLFYNVCLEVFQKRNEPAEVIRLQAHLLALNQKTSEVANHYVQNISEKYMKTENRLLQARIDDLNQQRKLTVFQLVAAAFGILVLMFGVLFFMRKSKLQQMLLEQKTEISKDLHDDIGSELSSIMINTNLLRMADEGKRQSLIDKINNTTAEISQRVNAFIWSLDNENDTVGNFVEYVKHFTSKLFDGADISVLVTEDLENVSHKIINGYFRKNLFFCVKEALNNAVRHSGATKILVSINGNEKSGLNVAISDNGKGIGEENLFGNGFNNIRKRVAMLKGTVRFLNQDGLTVEIKVPFPPK